jgi:hypothetical protein
MTAKRKKSGTQGQKKTVPAVIAAGATARGARGILSQWPLFFILGMTGVMYWPVLSAQGWLWNDFPEQNFVYRLFAAVSLKQGVFPFWNPYVFSGMPFFADVQAALLYPLNLILTPFASADWLSPLLVEYQIILHIALAGLFMFLLCRDFGCSRSAGVVGAMTFMFCGFLTAHIFHTNLVQTAAWFPLIVFLCRRMVEKTSLLYLSLCALTLANAFLAGYPQTMLHMYYWLAAWLVFSLIYGRRHGRIGWKSTGVKATLFAVMAALSIGISAVQLLPTSELGENSARPTMEFRAACEGSIYPYRLVTLLVPNFFGKPDNTYWGIGANDQRGGVHNYWETAAYSGIVPLLLALFAAVFVRTPLSLFLSIMGVFALLLSLGDSFFLYKLAYSLLPGLNRFRDPGRFALVISFSVALLAAFGLHALLTNTWHQRERLKKSLPRIAAGVAAAAVLGALIVSTGGLKGTISSFMLSSGVFGNDAVAIQSYIDRQIYPDVVGACWLAALLTAAGAALIGLRIAGRISARTAVIGCIAATAIDLLMYGYGYAARPADPNRMYEKSPVVRELQAQLKTEFFRVNSRDSKPGTTDLGGPNMLFQKNQGSVHRLFLMEGYNPLRLKHQIVERNPRALDILNVKYAIGVDPASKAMGFTLNPTCLPRGRMVYDYRVVTDAEKIPGILWSGAVDHRRVALLEEEPSVAPCASCDSVVSKVEITSYSLNAIDLKVNTGHDGLLVLSEIHYPCWKAQVDGRPAPIYRADYALRAIPVPAGNHRVRCYYDDAAFRRGRSITMVSLLATFALLVPGIVRYYRRRRLKSTDTFQ